MPSKWKRKMTRKKAESMMDCERRGLVTTENITALQSQLQESEELTHACEELENQEEVEEEQDGEPPSQSDEEADDSPEITQLEEVSVQLSISTYRASFNSTRKR
jgi:hypothetical protein